jgi:DNA (cytosine-5)-methyltransferase 1
MVYRLKAYSCDINKYASQVYKKRFNEDCLRNINDTDISSIPDFDILLAGFPCQPFSNAGQKKGFEDTRGTLFFDICRFLDVKKPRAFLLENVKGLVGHNKGETFKTILKHLNELQYNIHYKVLNSGDFGVPQTRQRIYIVGFKNIADGFGFEFPTPPKTVCKLKDVLEENVDKKYFFSKDYMNYLRTKAEREKARNNGFLYKITDLDAHSTTLIYSYTTLERNIVIDEKNFNRIPKEEKDKFDDIKGRRLTPIECERLQGFPDNWTEGISNTQRWKLIGNSVTVPVIKEITKNILEKLKQEEN